MRKFGFIIGLFFFVGSCGAPSHDAEINEEEALVEAEDTTAEEPDEWQEPSWDLESIQFQSDFDGCLPRVNPEFLGWIETDSLWQHFPYSYDPIYAYLSTHLDSTSTTIVLESDTTWGPTLWQKYFEGGILYEEEYYPEAGSSSLLKTNCTDMDYLMSILFPLIESEENTWNKDSTSYAPDGAGCGYDFTRDSIHQTIDVSWYCGC